MRFIGGCRQAHQQHSLGLGLMYASFNLFNDSLQFLNMPWHGVVTMLNFAVDWSALAEGVSASAIVFVLFRLGRSTIRARSLVSSKHSATLLYLAKRFLVYLWMAFEIIAL